MLQLPNTVSILEYYLYMEYRTGSQEPISDVQPDVATQSVTGWLGRKMHEMNQALAVLSGTAAVAGVTAADILSSPNPADAAAEIVHVDKNTTKVVIPSEKFGKITLAVAERELGKHRLHFAGALAGQKLLSHPKATQWEAESWMKRDVRHIKSHGRTLSKFSYTNLSPGSRVNTGTNIWVEVKKKPIVTPKIPVKNPPTNPPPPTKTTPPPPIEVTPPPEQQPPINIKAETQAYLAKNVVYLPFLNGCSGLLLRDNQDNPIGVVSDSHCGLRTATRTTGNDGNSYIALNKSLDVKQGENVNSLTTIGTVDQAIIPQQNDQGHDFTLMALKGVNPQEVETTYKANSLSDTQVTQLASSSPDQQIALSGYPLAEPTNTSGVTERATLWLSVVGMGGIFGTNGQFMSGLLAGSTASSSDTICSYGMSGAVGVEPSVSANSAGVKKVNYKYIGGLAGYDDFRSQGNTVGYNGPAIKQERSGEFNLSLTSVDYACYLASENSSAQGANSQTVRLVSNANQIP